MLGHAHRVAGDRPDDKPSDGRDLERVRFTKNFLCIYCAGTLSAGGNTAFPRNRFAIAAEIIVLAGLGLSRLVRMEAKNDDLI